jgi:hypothetical protein
MAEWVRLRACGIHFIHHESKGPGSIAGVGTVDKAVHSSGVRKMV